MMDCGDAQPHTPVPVNLHDQELMYPEHRFWEHVKENEMFHDQVRKLNRCQILFQNILY